MLHLNSNAMKFTPNGGDIQVNSYFIPRSDMTSSPSSLGSAKRKGSLSRVYVTGLSSHAPHASSSIDKLFGKIRIEFLDTGPGISEVILVLTSPPSDELDGILCVVLCAKHKILFF